MIYVGQNDTCIVFEGDTWEVVNHFSGKPELLCSNTNSKLMQYTGLKDENGKEIYEGDILKLNPEYRGYGEIPVSVFWGKGRWLCQGIMHYSHQSDLTSYALDKMEIIGNIHDNPELLKPQP
jgi:uncharacterized phage protein (TIGR01671 family)